MAKYQYSK